MIRAISVLSTDWPRASPSGIPFKNPESELIFSKIFDPFNGRLFQQFGSLCASLVTINQMQLEKIPISQRNKLLKRHGNCRSGMAKLLFESWARLGKFVLPLGGVPIESISKNPNIKGRP